jgi:hypothetical protein
MNAEEKYCNARSAAESAIGDMLKAGQAAGFTNEQILDDIKDALYNNDVKVEITEAT